MRDKGGNGEGDDDLRQWLQVIKDAIPLKNNKKIKDSRNYLKIMKTRDARVDPVPLPEAMQTGSEIDRRTDERLRKGQVPIDARLDLHGLTRIEAQVALERFLLSSYDSGMRCVLVVTGKGRDDQEGSGILRRLFPEWLASGPAAGIVLRHYPARPGHGGAGAFYVLIRRKRS